MKYIKKPIPIEAIQWDGSNFNEISKFMGDNHPYVDSKNELIIRALEGDMHAPVGSYIIRGVTGADFYPCQKEVFESSYTPIHEQKPYEHECSNCKKIFTIKPYIFYDNITQSYKYWSFCPFCNHKEEWT